MPLSQDDLKFLRAVATYGGSATTSEIRCETGFNRGKTRYRFDKLDESGLINISYADSRGAGASPRVATLTDDGEQVVRRRGENGPDRADEDKPLRESVERLHDRVDQMESRLDVLTQMYRDHEEAIDYSMGWMGLAEVYLKATRQVFEEEFADIDFVEVMEEVDEEPSTENKEQ